MIEVPARSVTPARSGRVRQARGSGAAQLKRAAAS
jgi:hypothetical protein